MFAITAAKVLMMIAYGVPGYLLIKTKALGEQHIKAFAKMLLFVCQPALAIMSFNGVDCTPSLLRDIGIFFIVTLFAQVAIIFTYSFVFKKKIEKDKAHKICAIASACGNVGFLGIPLLEYLIPNHPEVLVYSASFSMSMNIIAWTLGLVLMTGDRKYISVRSLIVNPATISFFVAFPLFVFGIKLPDLFADYIEIFGRMSTVVCMTVIGMRLGTKSLKRIFADTRIYYAAFSKLIVFPIIGALLFALMPVPQEVKSAAFILCCCPAAAMIQSLSETHGGNSEAAANILISTNLICIVTIPFMWTAYNYLFL
jgi:predicted permease